MQALVYSMLVAFLRLVTRFFFRTIEVVGLGNVPRAGPVIFVGNHPNSLVDPVMITTTCGRMVHLAAREGLFKMPHLMPILWALGSVPIKRRQDQAEGAKQVDNDDAFRALHAVLGKGGAFGIFPEGVSYTESELQPLKTGAARIALSARAEGIPVVIVPVGLSYRQRDHFRGRVLVQYGRPIVLEAGVEDSREEAKALTARIELALRALTLNAKDFDTLRVLDCIRRIYVPDGRDLSLADEAEITRRLLAHYEAKRDLAEVQSFYADVTSYLALLDALGLSDWDLRKPVSRSAWTMRVLRHVALLLVEVPFALPGLVIHMPILWAATRAGEMLLSRDDVRATMRMMIATLGVLVSQAAVGIAIVAHDPTPSGVLRAVLVLTFFAVSGTAAIRVLQKQAIVLHGLAVLMRILALKGELDALRAQRDDLRGRLVALTRAYADPSMVRIVTDAELSASP